MAQLTVVDVVQNNESFSLVMLPSNLLTKFIIFGETGQIKINQTKQGTVVEVGTKKEFFAKCSSARLLHEVTSTCSKCKITKKSGFFFKFTLQDINQQTTSPPLLETETSPPVNQANEQREYWVDMRNRLEYANLSPYVLKAVLSALPFGNKDILVEMVDSCTLNQIFAIGNTMAGCIQWHEAREILSKKELSFDETISALSSSTFDGSFLIKMIGEHPMEEIISIGDICAKYKPPTTPQSSREGINSKEKKTQKRKPTKRTRTHTT
eukprot:TRINITY_DN1136_c0_g3_i2.p1 TRINITY_DN1136_c0_g3~~TRINITY_DN1136_c0_g3_i2.p1  ORF type:complete len:267 (-),score=46.28 TRINITY_DN1136_c0_g3_i2:583-1383(-)